MGSSISTNQFWLSPKLAKWSSCHEPALTIVKGSYTSRSVMQDFCVDVIQYLAASSIRVVWALINAEKSKSGCISSTTDLMKYITFQALRLSGAVKTEKQMALRYSQFHTARTSKEWLDIFRRVVEDLGGQIYVIIDLATVRAPLEDAQGVNFILELSKTLDDAFKKGMATKIKVILLVYKPEWSILLPKEVFGSIILVKAMRQKRRQGAEMRRAINTGVFSNSSGRQGRIRQGR
jgi:hypothetical protein